jgi:gluconate 2-dehydrogenase gamma chain
MYREGPFEQGKPEQGYQLPFTPREFFAAGIAAADEWCIRTYGAPFGRLGPRQREAALRQLESGAVAFAEFGGRLFFEALLQIAMEGFFADPIYGGNRDKAGWRLVGYPGLPARYAGLIDEYRNRRYSAEPRSIADLS